MVDLILIVGHDLVDGPWYWALSDNSDHGQVQTAGEKTSLSANPNFSQVHIVVPGTHVVTKIHTLENLSDKYKRQAIGFSIEDDLAQPVADVHIGLDTNSNRIAVTSNEYMGELLSALGEFGFAADIITADYDSVSAQRFCFEGRLIESAGNGLGYAIETELANNFMDDEQSLPAEISAQEFLGKIIYARDEAHSSINLRVGVFSNNKAFGIKQFRRSGLLAAACLIAFMAINFGQGFQYSQKTKQAKTEMGQIYSRMFPGTKVPAKPIVKTLAARREYKIETGAVFIKLSSVLAKSIQSLDGVEVSSLRFNGDKAQLSLAINYKNFSDVEKLKRNIARNGGVFSEEGTRQNGSGITGNAVIRLGS